MLTAALAFGAALVTSAALTPLVRRMASRIGAVDEALSSRKVHATPIPRLGGVAIVAAFFAPIVGLFLVDGAMARGLIGDPRATVALFVGGLAIAALGIYDDVRGSDAKLKFMVQFAVAAMAYALGFRIEYIANPFGAAIALGPAALPFTLCFIVGITNAINLIDGLDGLAGGVAFIVVLTSFIAAAIHGDLLMMVFTAALAGAVLGFLFYNFNPASIFMGDTGSMFLGFVLALSSIQSHQKAHAVVAILVPIIAMGLPIADTLLAIGRRAATGLPLFRGDRGHIHHKLLAMGFSHRRVVLVLYGATTVLGLAGLLVASANGGRAALLIFGVALAGGLVLRRMGYLQLERLPEMLTIRRRNMELWRSMSEIHQSIQSADHVEGVWGAVKAAVPILNARWARVELMRERLGKPETVRLTDGRSAPDGAVRTQHGLRAGERLDRGFLELAWTPSALPVPREVEIAIEVLCSELLTALERIDVRASHPHAEVSTAKVIELRLESTRRLAPEVRAVAVQEMAGRLSPLPRPRISSVPEGRLSPVPDLPRLSPVPDRPRLSSGPDTRPRLAQEPARLRHHSGEIHRPATPISDQPRALRR